MKSIYTHIVIHLFNSSYLAGSPNSACSRIDLSTYRSLTINIMHCIWLTLAKTRNLPDNKRAFFINYTNTTGPLLLKINYTY